MINFLLTSLYLVNYPLHCDRKAVMEISLESTVFANAELLN